MMDLAWYWWIVIYLVGFMLTAFVTHLFKGEIKDPEDFCSNVFCTVFWPVFLPITIAVFALIYVYKLPMLLGEHCHKAVSKWGE